MNVLRILTAASVSVLLGLSDSIGGSWTSSETSALEGLSIDISMYAAMRDGQLPVSWSDLIYTFQIEGDFSRYDIFTRPIRDGRNLSQLYSFISTEERERFPEGEVILVRYEAIPRPDRGEGVRLRRFVYREQGGRIRSMTWDEDRFQAMLAETGITIPPPQPLPPEPPRPPRGPEQPSPQPSDPEMESAEEQPALPDASLLPEPPVEQPRHLAPSDEAEDSGNWGLLWLSSGVLALLILLFGWRIRRRASLTE